MGLESYNIAVYTFHPGVSPVIREVNGEPTYSLYNYHITVRELYLFVLINNKSLLPGGAPDRVGKELLHVSGHGGLPLPRIFPRPSPCLPCHCGLPLSASSGEQTPWAGRGSR